MSPTQIVVIVLVVLLIAAAVALAVPASRRRQLRRRFGPEYDRLVAERASRSEAEKELRDRERRHAELTLTPLSPESRARYTAAWEEVQLRFVDTPAEAVGEADALVARLVAERGYPTGDFDEQAAHLSVAHARTLTRYREAHEIHLRNERGEASTEELRQAVVHYRALVADLLGTEPVPAQPSTPHRTEPVAAQPPAQRTKTETPAQPPAQRRTETETPHDVTSR